MDVFISWSGPKSNVVAHALFQYLPLIIQSVRPFMSSDSIEAGARWNPDIAGQLERCVLGIFCITAANKDAPWLVFEAGAISKSLSGARACTPLIDLKPTDIVGPLSQFQHKDRSPVGIADIFSSINRGLGEKAITPSQFEAAFDKFWPDLEQAMAKCDTIDEGEAARTQSRRHVTGNAGDASWRI